MGPLWVLKATPCLPLSTFLPPPPFLPHILHTSKTYFGPSDESQLPWGSSRSAGALQAQLHAASLAMPPSFHEPRERGKEGRGGKEDNKLVKEPDTQYCDYSWSGEWGRGSHLVLERIVMVGGRGGMGSGSWGLGWCLGRGLGRGAGSLPGARNGGGQPGSTLLPPEHPPAAQEPGRELGESGEPALTWFSPA